MRSAVVLLGFLLASAQAFHIPVQSRTVPQQQAASGFLGQRGVSRRAVAPTARRATLVASLEDIERKLVEQEKAAAGGAKPKKGAAAAPPPAPKVAAPAPAPAPAAPKGKGKAAAPKPAPVAVGEFCLYSKILYGF